MRQAEIAPGKMIASKYLYDNPASGIAFQRPLRPFPEIARHIGNSDPTKAANWMCTIRNSLKIK
jgi:feruloyl esterase